MGSSGQSSRSGLQCGVLEVAEILWKDRDFGGLQKSEGTPGQLLDLGLELGWALILASGQVTYL